MDVDLHGGSSVECQSIVRTISGRINKKMLAPAFEKT